MTKCKNCFSLIKDLRKETRCSTCNEPLHKECAIKDGGTFLCDVCYTVKEEGDTLTRETQVEIPQVIRRSHIELYKSCPYAFYLEVIKGIKTKSSSYAQIGIDLHSLFHQASLGKITSTKQMINEYNPTFSNYTDELFEDDLHLYKKMTLGDLKEKLWIQVNDAVETFFHVLSVLPKHAFALEKKIEFPIGDNLPKVCITMDRVDEIHGELEMIDWKTGAVMVGKKLSSDLQAPLYIYAVRHHFLQPVRNFTFYYLPENKVRVFERINDDNYTCTVGKREYKVNLTDTIREIQSIFTKIKKGEFNVPKNTRNMYFTCKTCHFKKCGTCQGGDIESWQQYNKKK